MKPKHIQNNGLDDSDTFDEISLNSATRLRQSDEGLDQGSPAKSENVVDDEEELESIKQLTMPQSQQRSKISVLIPNQSNQASSAGRLDNQYGPHANLLPCLTPQLSQQRAQISLLHPSRPGQSLVSQSLTCLPKTPQHAQQPKPQEKQTSENMTFSPKVLKKANQRLHGLQESLLRDSANQTHLAAAFKSNRHRDDHANFVFKQKGLMR